MNRESSRSHAIFILDLESNETLPNGVLNKKTSRLNLVDLAGSERQKHSNSDGVQLKVFLFFISPKLAEHSLVFDIILFLCPHTNLNVYNKKYCSFKFNFCSQTL